MKKNKIFIACDSTNIQRIKEIIKKSKTSKLKIGYKFGLEFLKFQKWKKVCFTIKKSNNFWRLQIFRYPKYLFFSYKSN